MTRQEFAIISVGIKSAYPASKIMQDKESMELWYAMLQDFDAAIVNNAVMEYISTNQFPPNIAVLRKLCLDRCKPRMKTFDEAWAVVQKAMAKYGIYHYEKAFEMMDEVTLSVVKNLGWSKLCASENPIADRANFRDAYEKQIEQNQWEAQLPMFVATQKKQIQEKYIPTLESKQEMPKLESDERMVEVERASPEYIDELMNRFRGGEDSENC